MSPGDSRESGRSQPMELQMASYALDLHVRQHDGSVLDYEEDGVLIFDRRGARVTHLPASARESLPNDTAEWLTSFLENKDNLDRSCCEKTPCDEKGPSAQPSQLRQVTCWLDLAVLSDPVASEGLRYLVASKPDDVRVVLACHSQRKPPNTDWRDVLGTLVAEFAELTSSGRLAWQLTGALGACSTDEMDFLWDHSFQLCYLHSIDAADPGFSEETRQVIGAFAEFGFRVPFAWYVDASNIKVIPRLIDEAMDINMNCGFRLPLVSERPFAQSVQLPDIDDYLDLLVKMHERYPHYDDVFAPLSGFVAKVMPSSLINLSQLFLWMTPEEPIRVSRVAFEDACPSLTWNELPQVEGPFELLLQETNHNDACEACESRVLCRGGLQSDSNANLLYCQTARLFLKAFAWQRWLLTQSCETKCNDGRCESTTGAGIARW